MKTKIASPKSLLSAISLAATLLAPVLVYPTPVDTTFLNLAGEAQAASNYPAPQLVTSQPPQIVMSRPVHLQPTALPGLGTSITRITDADTFGGEKRFYRHYYSKQQPWNSDGTRMILSHDSSNVYFLDGKTYAYQFTQTNVPEYPKWSNTNPDLMYATIGGSNPKFVKYIPSTNTTQILKTFPEFSDMWLGVGEGNLSNDDRYAPLVGVTSDGRTVVIYDTVNNVEVGRKDFPGVSTGLDWASMSQSGNYVVIAINVDGIWVYKVYDKQMNFLRTLSAYAGGHADLGYDSAGDEVIVYGQFVGGKGVILMSTRLADDVAQQQLPGTPQPDGIVYMASNYHISCRNTSRPGYCYISNFAFEFAHDAYMFHEVFALKLDGSGTVERYSQDFAAPFPVADLEYTRCSMVVPNRDGSRVLFSSDWGDPSSSAIIYDYVAGVQPTPPSPIPGDLNSDSLINLTDFNILKTDFLKLAANLANPRSDINGDGQATVKDVGILMSGWK